MRATTSALLLAGALLSAGAFAQGNGGSNGTKEPNESTTMQPAQGERSRQDVKAEAKAANKSNEGLSRGDKGEGSGQVAKKAAKGSGKDRKAVHGEAAAAEKGGQLAPEKDLTKPVKP